MRKKSHIFPAIMFRYLCKNVNSRFTSPELIPVLGSQPANLSKQYLLQEVMERKAGHGI